MLRGKTIFMAGHDPFASCIGISVTEVADGDEVVLSSHYPLVLQRYTGGLVRESNSGSCSVSYAREHGFKMAEYAYIDGLKPCSRGNVI